MGHLHRGTEGNGNSARISADKFNRISDKISALDEMYDTLANVGNDNVRSSTGTIDKTAQA